MEKADYEALAAFRAAIRRFLQFSEAAAKAAGLSPPQHQLMLAVKGTPGRDWASVGELADRLGARQTAVTNLVGRMEAAGLVARRPDPRDGRGVAVHLTPRGDDILARLSQQHMAELTRMPGFAFGAGGGEAPPEDAERG
ncbi:MAG TPA: MarR family transcriptional regulator [Armatimonadota bacterium]|jgi:DNA-binding MarR family transcriptional regulator